MARGSLIFFEPPGSPLLDKHFGEGPHLFGKRVLGLPDDVVSHEGEQVLVNGRVVGRRLEQTRLGLKLSPGPEGVIPRGCYYVGSDHPRSEEHTSELQSLMRTPYAVFCLQKKYKDI